MIDHRVLRLLTNNRTMSSFPSWTPAIDSIRGGKCYTCIPAGGDVSSSAKVAHVLSSAVAPVRERHVSVGRVDGSSETAPSDQLATGGGGVDERNQLLDGDGIVGVVDVANIHVEFARSFVRLDLSLRLVNSVWSHILYAHTCGSRKASKNFPKGLLQVSVVQRKMTE